MRCLRGVIYLVLTTHYLVCSTSSVHAHPVPRKQHDRTIVVRLLGDAGSCIMTARVAYRLAVDETTVVLDDEPALGIAGKIAPSAALQDKPATDLKPGDEEKLRWVAVRFSWPAFRAAARTSARTVPPAVGKPAPGATVFAPRSGNPGPIAAK